MAPSSFKLNTGQEIPALGLGTWQSPAGEVEKAVTYALKDGYKLIDCAYCYGNEEEVGAGLKAAFEAGVKREDIFVVTKVWATYNTRPELGLDKSLKALGLDYVDLFLVHWPLLLNPEGNDDKFPKKADGSRDVIRDYNHVDGWKLMEKLPATGKTRGVGVCNYSKKYLEELLPHATIIPAVNQIENHPSLPQQEIVDFCKEKGIHIEAYSPFGSTGGPVMTAEPVVKIAEKKGVSASTVLLSYHGKSHEPDSEKCVANSLLVARGSTVLAKSVTPERITANKTIVDLDDEDMKALNDYSEDLVKKGEVKRYVYPPFGIDFGFPDKS
ncbi:alcohol dehydrogenase [Fusarium proliferatum]|uniref:Alcohol dehydrogenase n=1 Tax=Gibberella intermedia TaxID=948311 RepID=A0A365N1P6_GIBIN|nr:alcohol dehydrogenase [Fusarium proliferatum]KLO78754.1 putative aldehyde reductase [Fusarium fujikuroi]KLP14808.1 putative aldehyde reductase [Fusarium fujikuroi]RBA14729.1 alcohol dehydrogenase [Fusarium proliferatum]CVL10956.1 probable aldehyde reductase [Fusarium proliferatum]